MIHLILVIAMINRINPTMPSAANHSPSLNPQITQITVQTA